MEETEKESQEKQESTAENKQEDTVSKRQLKRLKKKEKYLANLPAKRAREKEKLKLRRSDAREKNIKLGPSRKELKRSTMSNSKCKIKVVLDFSFDDLMNPKDVSKCVNQAMRCYSKNRRSENPMQFYIVNFKGKSKEEMGKHNGYDNWDVNIHSEEYLELFNKDDLVYLTSDSDNVIETLEDDKVYIIGALVDHNSQKGLCYKIAKEQGIGHGHLPIGEHLDLKTRKVLAVNHVFEIMLNVCNGMNWKDAFIKVLPQRKGAKAKCLSSDDSIVNEETVEENT